MARLGLLFEQLEEANMADDYAHQLLRRQMRGNPVFCPFSYLSDKEFFDTYRLNKSLGSMAVHELEPYLPSIRSTSVPTVSKVLTAIAFYASGSYQRSIGQATQHSVSQPTVSKCVREVTEAFNTPYMREKYIRFPQTAEERKVVKKGFYDKFRLPGVLGCVDGTHVAVVRPEQSEERYFNRKRYHSINTQIVCDSDLNIISVDASHGGATHDSFIWERCPLRQHMEDLQQTESAWFLGDSGYSQRRWMMTPILNAAANSPEQLYTEMQMSARSSVERAIGVLKARWRCLLVHRVLHYDPVTAGKITNACVILHNIANASRVPVPELTDEEQRQESEWQIFRAYSDEEAGVRQDRARNQLLAQGRSMRRYLVNRIW